MLIQSLAIAASLALSSAVAGPRKPPKTHASAKARHPRFKSEQLVENVFSVTSAPIPNETKIFLIAGSSLSASFAREVIDQKKIWLKAGFRESEIACYYVVPLQEDFNDNQKEFLSEAGELAKCYPMSVRLLRQHLAAVSSSGANPPFVYFYVSSHGDQPVSETLKTARTTDDDYWALRRDTRFPVFDQYQLLVEGLPDGTATSTEILGALRAGMPPEDLYLTPKSLGHALAEYFARIPKFVVLQGCFTGGFIEDTVAARKPDLLTRLKNVTVLTAARYDRSSFGCDPGAHTTFFGGVFNEALARRATDPRGISWTALYSELTKKIAALEKREKTSPPSLPQFFSNYQAPRR